MAGLNSIDLKSRLQNKNCELINRKKLVERTKNLSSDVCCILAALGFFLMVLENELFFLGAFQQVLITLLSPHFSIVLFFLIVKGCSNIKYYQELFIDIDLASTSVRLLFPLGRLLFA